MRRVVYSAVLRGAVHANPSSAHTRRAELAVQPRALPPVLGVRRRAALLDLPERVGVCARPNRSVGVWPPGTASSEQRRSQPAVVSALAGRREPRASLPDSCG